MTFSPALMQSAEALLAACRERGWTVTAAESCTGGLISGLLTEIPGSSDVVDRGFVTYSNQAKEDLLGVPRATLASVGAVSRETARAMAAGACRAADADVAVAVTGVAGPGGGSVTKPVGLVHIAATLRGADPVHEEHRFGDIGRGPIRIATVAAAMSLLTSLVEGS